MQSKPLRIGTRGSRLALTQAEIVRTALVDSHGFTAADVEIVVITTTGDRVTDRPLGEIGGKGLFTKEIEEALSDGRIDLAVHSAKDMPTLLPPGLGLAGYLPREDVRDAIVVRPLLAVDGIRSLADLPHGAKVGTASLRRGALVRRLRPDLQVEVFRGNVQTRLDKLERGVVDATLLAVAGLKRLGQAQVATEILDAEAFPPAVGQGAIAIETRLDDAATARVLAPILDPATAIALEAERAFLLTLDGSCRTPIAGHGIVTGERLTFRGLILKPDGSESHEIVEEGAAADAAAIGRAAGGVLRARGGPDFFAGD